MPLIINSASLHLLGVMAVSAAPVKHFKEMLSSKIVLLINSNVVTTSNVQCDSREVLKEIARNY